MGPETWRGVDLSTSAAQCFFVIAAWVKEIVEEFEGLDRSGGVYDVL
jgi:hypothetical protein